MVVRGKEATGINFIVKLTKFIGFNIVIIIINSVFKRVYFVPTYTMVTIENTARLFLYYVWKLHNLPNHCYRTLWILTILFYFILFFLILYGFCFCFSFEWWKGMWHHRPRIWWKNLKDDVRAHVYNIAALSKV